MPKHTKPEPNEKTAEKAFTCQGISDEHRLIRLPVVREMLGNVSKTAIYDWMRRKQLAEPVKLGKGAVAWRLSDIKSFIDSRV